MNARWTRWSIVALLTCFSMMSFMLRMNISIAAKFMMVDLGLNQIQMGQIFGSFMLGYALLQIPAGALGDRWGPRRVLTLAGLSWGVTTLLTALVPGVLVKASVDVFGALLVIRFLLGTGQAATYPVAARAISNWIRPSDRALTNATVIAGAMVGSTVTPPFISWWMVHYGWRSSFCLTACAAIALSFLWWALSADSPEHYASRKGLRAVYVAAKKGTSVAPRSAICSWSSILAKREIWILSVSYMFDSYLLFIFVFWLYTYLIDVRGFSLIRGGFFTSLPYAVAIVMTPAGGLLCDQFCVRFGARRGRRIVPVASLLLSSLFLFIGAKVKSPYLAIAVICASVGFIEATEGAYWCTATDIDPSHAGATGGVMNTFGNFGGVFSTVLVPVLVKHFGWMNALSSGMVCALVGASLWYWVCVDRTVVKNSVGTQLPSF
jgi:MFS transporter, ACS family, glucarate transporter